MLKTEKNYDLYQQCLNKKPERDRYSIDAVSPILRKSNLLIQVDEYDELKDTIIDTIKTASNTSDITILELGGIGNAAPNIINQLSVPFRIGGSIILVYSLSRIVGSMLDEAGKDLYKALKKTILNVYQKIKTRKSKIYFVVYLSDENQTWYMITPYSDKKDVEKTLEIIPSHFEQSRRKTRMKLFELNPKTGELEEYDRIDNKYSL